MKFFIFLFLFVNTFLFCENKVVYLISTPRSMSTFFCKIMDTREDFKVYSEPLTPIFFNSKISGISSFSFDGTNHTNTSSFVEEVQRKQKKSNIFIKDISSFLSPFISDLHKIINDPNTYFVFLARDPHEEIISWYKMFKAEWRMRSATTDLYKIYSIIKKLRPNRSKIVFTSDLKNNSEKTMKQFCSYIDIPFSKSMIQNLPILTAKEAKTRWSDPFRFYGYVHRRTLKSKKIIPGSKSYLLDENGKPSFSELNFLVRKKAKNLYKNEKPYFDKFKTHAEDHLTNYSTEEE